MAKSEVGKVISAKMEKTVVVQTQTKVMHPLYKKQVKKTRTYKAHDELGAKVGNSVRIAETKPYSRSVHFKVEEIIS